MLQLAERDVDGEDIAVEGVLIETSSTEVERDFFPGELAYLGLGLFDRLDPGVIVSPRFSRHVPNYSSYLLSDVDILRHFPPMLEVIFRLQVI